MKIYVSASDLIKKGIPTDTAVDHIRKLYSWLRKNDYLSCEGIKKMDAGIDEKSVVSDETITEAIKDFMSEVYSVYLESIDWKSEEFIDTLDIMLGAYSISK